MWRRWTRLSARQKVLSGMAVGTVAAGAYCVSKYMWDLYQESEKEFEQYLKEREEVERETSQEKIASHYLGIQNIACSTTLPCILPHLEERITVLLDPTPLTSILNTNRQHSAVAAPAACASASSSSSAAEASPSSPQPLTQEQKYALWTQLQSLSLSRLCAAGAGVAALTVLLRVQLNIIGRYIYLDSVMPSTQTGGRPPTLSKNCQHMFLAYAEYLPQKGLDSIVLSLQECVRIEFQGVSIKDKINHSRLSTLVSQVEGRLGRMMFLEGAWQAVLLPPAHHNHHFNQTTTTTHPNLPLPVAAPASPSDQDENDMRMLSALLMELRVVIEGPEFKTVLADAINTSGAILSESLMSLFEDDHQELPVPKLIPRIVNMALDLMKDPNPIVPAVAGLKSLETLCANLYSSPPAFP